MDVGASDERFIARAGDHGGAQLVVLSEPVESCRDGAFAGHAQGVAAAGVVDGQIGDVASVATVVDAA